MPFQRGLLLQSRLSWSAVGRLCVFMAAILGMLKSFPSKETGALKPSPSRGGFGWGWVSVRREGTGSNGLFGFPGADGKPIPSPARPARRSAPGVRSACAAMPHKQADLTPLKGRGKSGFGSVESFVSGQGQELLQRVALGQFLE